MKKRCSNSASLKCKTSRGTEVLKGSWKHSSNPSRKPQRGDMELFGTGHAAPTGLAGIIAGAVSIDMSLLRSLARDRATGYDPGPATPEDSAVSCHSFGRRLHCLYCYFRVALLGLQLDALRSGFDVGAFWNRLGFVLSPPMPQLQPSADTFHSRYLREHPIQQAVQVFVLRCRLGKRQDRRSLR